MNEMTQVLGIVAMEPKGEWNLDTYYEKLNIVTYNDSTYMALEGVVGEIPSTSSKWQLIGGGVRREDIVDNLNSNDATKMLSAKQGKILNEGKVQVFDTVALMKAADLKEGMTAQTLGYYSINDGGEAIYKITDEESQTDYQEELENDLYATLIIENNIVNVKQTGAYGDGLHDDLSYIQSAIDKNPLYTIYFPVGTYAISNKIVIKQANSKGVNLKLEPQAIIKNISSNELATLIEIGVDTTDGTYSRVGNNPVIFIEGGTLDCTNVVKGMTLDSGRQLVQLSKMVFKNVNQYGLYLSKNLSYESGDHKISYCDFFSQDSYEGTAIYGESYDNELNHIRIDGCKIGIKIMGGSYFLYDIHATAIYSERVTSQLRDETIGFDFQGGNIKITQCYSDTYAIGFAIHGTGTYQISDSMIFYYDAFDENSTTSAIDISKSITPYISIINTSFNSAINGNHAFIRFNNNGDYINMINNDLINLYNNHYNNKNEIVSYYDPIYCLQLNNKRSITPYYSGQSFDSTKYYYLGSFVYSSYAFYKQQINIKNNRVFNTSIQVDGTNYISLISGYVNKTGKKWKVAMTSAGNITFSDNTTAPIYDLWVTTETNLTSDVNMVLSPLVNNAPFFSYRKLTVEGVEIDAGDILYEVEIPTTS